MRAELRRPKLNVSDVTDVRLFALLSAALRAAAFAISHHSTTAKGI
ncbi:MAG TPA: hypothetical protein VIN40_02040 [Candidatus Tyrphobacter sp.]